MKLAFSFANQIAKIIKTDYIDRIAHIDLSRNCLQDAGSQLVVDAIKNSYQIVSLNLMHNDISPEGMTYIFSELAGSESLVTLLVGASDSYNRNRFGANTLDPFIKFVDTNRMVQFLNVASVQLGTVGFKALFDLYANFAEY